MNLKKGTWILILSGFLTALGLAACVPVAPAAQSTGEPAKAAITSSAMTAAASIPAKWVDEVSQLPPGKVSHIDVVYFHRTERCESCLNAEAYTRETIDRYFAGEVKSGLVSLHVLNVEKPENAAMVKKFDTAGVALYLGIQIEGTEYLCPNQDIWFTITNKSLFIYNLQKKITALVGRGV